MKRWQIHRCTGKPHAWSCGYLTLTKSSTLLTLLDVDMLVRRDSCSGWIKSVCTNVVVGVILWYAFTTTYPNVQACLAGFIVILFESATCRLIMSLYVKDLYQLTDRMLYVHKSWSLEIERWTYTWRKNIEEHPHFQKTQRLYHNIACNQIYPAI